MADANRLSELLQDWQEAFARGEDVPVAELCRGCPELEAELARRIAAVRHVDGLASELRAESSPSASPATAGGTVIHTPDGSSDTPGPDRPAGSGAAAEAAALLSPPEGPGELGRLGPYRVLRVLGHGGMGVVFAAEDSHLRRPVALKVMRPGAAADPAARERFLREARAAAGLGHDHVVTVYQAGEAGGVPFLAMPLLKGESLEARLRRAGPLEPAEAVRLGRQVAAGLAHAHGRGVIHRDIKPANVWLEEPEDEPSGEAGQGGGPGWRAKLLDFGLARAAGDAGLTATGVVLGTPIYMAPEQARGQKAGPAADLYGLGAVLYRACTGQPPFTADNLLALLRALAKQPPRPVRELNPSVPAALADLVMELLAKDPAARPASAQAVADRLAALERDLAPEAGPPAPATPEGSAEAPTPSPAGRKGRRRWWAAAVAAALLLPLTYLFGGSVIRYATDRGEVVIETDDPGVEVTIKDRTAVVYDRVKDRRFILKPGEYELEVREDSSDGVQLRTKQFTLTRGGKEIINARLMPLAAKPAPEPVKPPAAKTSVPPVQPAGEFSDPDAERRMAEWALARGGIVRVRGAAGEQLVAVTGGLPGGPFRLVEIDLGNCGTQVTDAGLAQPPVQHSCRRLNLSGTAVGDAGLARLSGHPELQALDLSFTQVTDAVAAHLQTLPGLTELSLSGNAVTDAGLVPLRGLTGLRELDLTETKVTAGGVAALRKALPGCRVRTGAGADRQAVESLLPLSAGITIRVGGQERGVKATKDLPAEPFQVVRIQFWDNRPLTDAGLANLRGLRGLTDIGMFGERVGDAGLAHLQGLTSLTGLSLIWTRVGDAGLRHLGGLPRLTGLSLIQTRVTDDGLSHLQTLPNLRDLWLNNTGLTDAGVEHLLKHRYLRGLGLGETKVTDAGLARLQALPGLEYVTLHHSRVSDNGLAHLRALPQLHHIVLDAKQLTEAGSRHLRELPNLTYVELFQAGDVELARLRELPKLRHLTLFFPRTTDTGLSHLAAIPNLVTFWMYTGEIGEAGLGHLRALKGLKGCAFYGTQVAATGPEQLRTALPGCQVTWESYYDAKSRATVRRAAERVLARGGKVRIGCISSQQTIAAAAELPEGFFSLIEVDFRGSQRVTDADVEGFHFRSLDLSGTPVGDAGLERLRGSVSLHTLTLAGTRVTDAGLVHLQALPILCDLSLRNTAVTDAGLAHLRGLARLRELDLTGTRVTEAGVAALRQALPDCLVRTGPSK